MIPTNSGPLLLLRALPIPFVFLLVGMGATCLMVSITAGRVLNCRLALVFKWFLILGKGIVAGNLHGLFSQFHTVFLVTRGKPSLSAFNSCALSARRTRPCHASGGQVRCGPASCLPRIVDFLSWSPAWTALHPLPPSALVCTHFRRRRIRVQIGYQHKPIGTILQFPEVAVGGLEVLAVFLIKAVTNQPVGCLGKDNRRTTLLCYARSGIQSGGIPAGANVPIHASNDCAPVAQPLFSSSPPGPRDSHFGPARGHTLGSTRRPYHRAAPHHRMADEVACVARVQPSTAERCLSLFTVIVYN